MLNGSDADRGPEDADPLPGGAWVQGAIAALAACIVEQFDHGVLLLAADGSVLLANRVALRECARHGALRLQDGQLVAIRHADAERLTRALVDTTRGLRTLLRFDDDERSLPLVVLPLNAPTGRQPGATTLALLAKRGGTEPLNIDLYARATGLTITECKVLRGLTRGLDPASLAQDHGVALSTVRTQIAQIRQKTGAGSIRQLLSRVNNLPPVVCATEVNA